MVYVNNKLVINVNKTQCVHFELSNTNNMTKHPLILLQNTSLSYVECVKYLGVYIDTKLN